MMTKTLTTGEAVLLIAGAGLGTGILAIPWAAARVGFWGVLAAWGLAVLVNLGLYWMIADLTRHTRAPADLLTILEQHVFLGWGKKILRPIFLVTIVVIMVENLIVYLLTASQVLVDLLLLPLPVAQGLFYVLASSLIFYGIKAVGIGEKIGVILLSGVVIILSLLTFTRPLQPLALFWATPKQTLYLYGLFMFAFSTIFSLIQVTNHLATPKKLKQVLSWGLGLNAAITLGFTVIVLWASREVTTVATIGLASALNYPGIWELTALLVLVAMLTSYWSIGLAFKDLIQAQLKTSSSKSWLIATIPTLGLALVLPLGILEYIKLGAGALSLVIGLMIIPAYARAIRDASDLLAGRFGRSHWWLGLMFLFTLLMAVAAVISLT